MSRPEAVLLTRARKAANLSQVELAEGAGVSRAMVQAIERGTRTGSDAMIAALAWYLHITPDRLATEGRRPAAAAILAERPPRAAGDLAERIAGLDPVVQATITEFLDKVESAANRNGRTRPA